MKHSARASHARRLAFRCAAVAALLVAEPAPAQVVLDGSLGTPGAVPGPTFLIPVEAGQQRGGNLFHSFSQLSIAQGEILGFLGPPSVQNILARVTGDSPSSIDGTIATNIADVNLFLINPNGITIGPNASILVGGSFVATTANFIRFTDGGRFDATDVAQTVLTSSPPSAFGFLGPSSGPIAINGSFLSVNNGETISLVGGDISIVGGAFVRTGGGRMNVASGSGAGELVLDPIDTNAVIDASGLPSRGSVVVSSSSFVSADGDDAAGGAGGPISVIANDLIVINSASISSSTAGAQDGGVVDIDVSGTILLDNAGSITTSTSAAGRGGDLAVDAGAVRIINTEAAGLTSFISTFTFGAGRSGDVKLRARNLSLEASRPFAASISTSGADAGIGGDLDIEADEISLTGFNASIRTTTSAATGGAGGSIKLRVDQAKLLKGGQLSALSIGGGLGGAIDIEAIDSIVVDGTDLADDGVTTLPSSINTTTVLSTAGAQGIRLKSPRVQLSGEGNLNTETFDVNAAPINVEAGTLHMDFGRIVASTSGAGAGGMIDVKAGVLDMFNQATLRSSSIGTGAGGVIAVTATERIRMQAASEIGAFAGGTGAPGGSVTVTVPDLEVSGESILTTGTVDAGDAGPLTITADRILFTGPKSGIASPTIVSKANSQSGTGGMVVLTASESIILADGARVSTSAGVPESGSFDPAASTTSVTGVAGDAVLAAPLIRITGKNGAQESRVTSTTNVLTPGTGGGGNVLITAGRLEVTDLGLISADTRGSGAGGNIGIVADDVLVDGATVSASSSFMGDPARNLTPGVGGSVTIAASRSVNLRQAALVSVESVATDAGSIQITSNDRLRVTDSTVITRAAGTGGDITLGDQDATTGAINPFVIIFDSAVINANAVRGSGGNIRIISDEYVTSSDSLVTATSEQSVPGKVDVSAAYTELAGGLVRLPGALSNEAARLQELCGLGMTGETSSFITTGRGGAPITPEGVLPSFDLPTAR